MLEAFGAARRAQHIPLLFSCPLTFQERRFGFRKMVWLSGKSLGCGNARGFWTEASAVKEGGKSVRKGKGHMGRGWMMAERYEHWSLCLSFC